MKKALAILMIFALVASVAVAEVAFGAWGRGIFLPAMSNGEDTLTDTAPSWGGWAGDESRIGFTMAGKSDNVGFVIDGNVDGGAFSMGDNQYIWVKPVDMLTVRMGNIYDDTLRGNAAFGSFNWYRALGNADGDDITFSRIGINRSREGFELALKPMDALYVAIYFYDLDKNLAENLFKNMQFAAGYTIDGIGQIKAQILTKAVYEGTTSTVYGWVDDDGDPATDPIWDIVRNDDGSPKTTTSFSREADDQQVTVEVAFNLTMVENLFVEAGFMMNTNSDVDPAETKKFALYGKYTMDALTIHLASINGMFKAVDTEFAYKIVAGVDYSLDGGIGISADFAFAGTTVEDSDPVYSFFAGATKGFSNGLIGAGVQVKNNGEDTIWGIPVRMEYCF